jgi:hypothetical protein
MEIQACQFGTTSHGSGRARLTVCVVVAYSIVPIRGIVAER